METRLIVASVMFAILALVAIAGGIVVLRVWRAHTRQRR